MGELNSSFHTGVVRGFGTASNLTRVSIRLVPGGIELYPIRADPGDLAEVGRHGRIFITATSQSWQRQPTLRGSHLGIACRGGEDSDPHKECDLLNDQPRDASSVSLADPISRRLCLAR